MKITIYLLLGILLYSISAIDAQKEADREITLRGKIVTHDNRPVVGAQIYIDMVNSAIASNKRGHYKLKAHSSVQLITVYHPAYGYVNWKYNGEKKIDFVFPEIVELLSEKEFEALGYIIKPVPEKERNWYGDYSSVFDILNLRFNNVRIVNDQIIIGRSGTHVVTGDTTPLIMVNDQPVTINSLQSIATNDIASIKVVSKGSESAAYGFRGVNGVIEIQLKDGTN